MIILVVRGLALLRLFSSVFFWLIHVLWSFSIFILTYSSNFLYSKLSGVQYKVYIQYQSDVKAKLDIVHFQCNWFSGWSIPNTNLFKLHINTFNCLNMLFNSLIYSLALLQYFVVFQSLLVLFIYLLIYFSILQKYLLNILALFYFGFSILNCS